MQTSNFRSRSGRILELARQRGFLSSRQALVLLGLIFLAPAFVAWVMHNSTEEGWKPEGTTNRGNLVHPARPLQLPADMTTYPCRITCRASGRCFISAMPTVVIPAATTYIRCARYGWLRMRI
jgi:hypothetical protein